MVLRSNSIRDGADMIRSGQSNRGRKRLHSGGSGCLTGPKDPLGPVGPLGPVAATLMLDNPVPGDECAGSAIASAARTAAATDARGTIGGPSYVKRVKPLPGARLRRRTPGKFGVTGQ
jgi:hypothetical protein